MDIYEWVTSATHGWVVKKMYEWVVTGIKEWGVVKRDGIHLLQIYYLPPPCPLSLTVTNEKEAEMMQEGGEEPIMLRHHLKTLNEGGSMIGCRCAFVQVECNRTRYEGTFFGEFQTADTPINI